MWSTLRYCLNRKQIPSLTKTCIRRYMKTSNNMELLLKQSDQIPFSYNLIYRHRQYKLAGLMYHSVHLMVCVTISSSSYYLYTNGFITEFMTPTEFFKKLNSPFETIVVCIATLAMVTLANVVRRRYVIRIYFNQKEKMYKSIFVGKYPFTVERHEFPAACMTYVSKDSILPWKNTLFNANGRKIMVFDENFKTPGDFYAMLRPEELENENL